MTKNTYIPKDTQKGFLTGLPGCLEHAFTLFEALRDAKTAQKQIVVAWIDLANAYGSVRHNLIQFALNWYHVPPEVHELVFDYYEKLVAMIVTKQWSTGFFLFDIGLFQGCVLSTILFDCVFQLLLDFLRPLDSMGYQFKTVGVRRLTRAYADDLAFTAKNTVALQCACDRTQSWLDWTDSMKAKPKKCISFGMKLFTDRIKKERFEPFSDRKSGFLPFDPQVSIAGHRMRFMVDIAKSDDSEALFQGTHFKFLGRWIHYLLTEKDLKVRVKRNLENDMNLVDKSKLTGHMKLWLYQFYVLAHCSWPFMVQDFNRHFAAELAASVSLTLKRWAGLYRNADVGALFRSREQFGLGLTSLVEHFERMQFIKCSLLQHSVDNEVRTIYEARLNRHKRETGRIWRPAPITESLESDVSLQLKFPTQRGRQGLGCGNFNAEPSDAVRRKMLIAAARSRSAHRYVGHAHSLSMQGGWLQWAERATPFDLSWNNLLYGGLGSHLISFLLNATINCVATPYMLSLWGYKQAPYCPLCGADLCTLHHILVNCSVALNSGRYTWRHDSVLLHIETVLKPYLSRWNALPPPRTRPVPHISKSFVPQGAGKSATIAPVKTPCVLDGARDWLCLVDYDHAKIVFPPEICATAERPDITIWSRILRTVILIELTCPAEEGIEPAQLRKNARYQPLCDLISAAKPSWTPILLTIEVGMRGCVAHSVRRCLQKLGLTRREINTLCRDLSELVARCSYGIFLARSDKYWTAGPPLRLGEDDDR